MRIREIHFTKYRAFDSACLPLEPLTVLIGPNNSGKTSALNAITDMAMRLMPNSPFPGTQPVRDSRPIWLSRETPASSELGLVWDDERKYTLSWPFNPASPRATESPIPPEHFAFLKSGRIYAFNPDDLRKPSNLQKNIELSTTGLNLPTVLTVLQDKSPERFENLNRDLRLWLPEFDRILFDLNDQGQRVIMLRTINGGYSVPADKVSAGTLLSVALLTICHSANPPAILGLEEPDFGLHPRLLRGLKDSLTRLTDPQLFNENRNPTQVILTTHSPYLVDLFRDELESVVLVTKVGLHSRFTRMLDLPNIKEIVRDANLGETWFSGVLGGVPVAS